MTYVHSPESSAPGFSLPKIVLLLAPSARRRSLYKPPFHQPGVAECQTLFSFSWRRQRTFSFFSLLKKAENLEMASGDDPPRNHLPQSSGGRSFLLVEPHSLMKAAGPSTGLHPPYPYPYYYPYPVQHEQGGPSRPPEVGASNHAAATDKRQYIEPEGDNFNPSRPPIHMIRDIIKSKYDAPYLSWKKIPKPKEFRWLPEYSTRIRTNFERRGATHLRDMFTDIRKFGQHPNGIGEGVWADLSSAWATPEFIKMREQNKQNRASNCGSLGSSLNTGGSVPHTEHRRRLKEHLGREPTPLELHTRTHQHQADNQWVDEKSKKAHDDFVRARESRQSTSKGSSYGSAHIFEYQICSYTSAFHDPSGTEESVSEKVAALTREIEEMRRVQSIEIEEMRKVQNEMQAELQSYRVENQRKKEQEEQPSPDSEDIIED
ncbi:hypothetical protein KFK09_022692 [Dendrobium nobile]|uniref:Transposase, Ptta/En/Spm, plant n=1 Tax=Dendrobium nobile TaxID=94219 RepID=A0A8T3AII7_DENNO|nr:hypothetical protein KFK09_022692 [Dendrobium nobile]